MDPRQRDPAAYLAFAMLCAALMALAAASCMPPQQPSDVGKDQMQLLTQSPQSQQLRLRFYHDQRFLMSASGCQSARISVQKGKLLVLAPSQPALMLEPGKTLRAVGVESLSLQALQTTIADVTFERDPAHPFASAEDFRDSPNDPNCATPATIGLTIE